MRKNKRTMIVTVMKLAGEYDRGMHHFGITKPYVMSPKPHAHDYDQR